METEVQTCGMDANQVKEDTTVRRQIVKVRPALWFGLT